MAFRPVWIAAACVLALAVVAFASPDVDPDTLELVEEMRTRLRRAFGSNFTMQGTAPPWQRGWHTVWTDEFSTGSLDTSKWKIGYLWGNAHNHRGVSIPERVSVSGGQLHLSAALGRHPTAPNDYWDNSLNKWIAYDCTTGVVHSPYLRLDNAFVEARVRFPETLGFWPAFWMVDASGTWPPEIDIVEHLTQEPGQSYYYYHYKNSAGSHASWGAKRGGPSYQNSYHIFGVEWNAVASSTYIRFFIDQVEVGGTFTSSYVSQARNMYLILNLGVGGWARDPDSTTDWSKAVYDIDWVRVWKP